MKTASDLERQGLEAKYHEILDFDKREIDNPDKYHPTRLYYLGRITKVIQLIRREFPDPSGIKIGDFASAQGNIGLILAEMGHKVFVIDINPTFIEYSKMKYERGKVEYIVANIEDLEFLRI